MKRNRLRHSARRARRYGMTTNQYMRANDLAWDAFGRRLVAFVHFFRLALGRARQQPSTTREHFDRVREWERGR